MNPELLFKIANNTALLGWVVLIVAPRWRWSARLVGPVLIPALLAVLYATLVVTQFGHSGGGFSSLPSVSQLFQKREILLAGWVHYLAFDLFVGSWEVREAARIGIAHALVIPCLILTFLFGPVGWLLFLVIRSLKTHSIEMTSVEESVQAIATN
jgi:hypothetical protein